MKKSLVIFSNKTISVTNKRNNDAKVFDGKKWKTMKKDMLINEVVYMYERELTNYAEENNNKKYIDDYESAKKRRRKNIFDVFSNGEKDLIEEVNNVLYDNSDKINTKKTYVFFPKIKE